jgi:hypothetical protein
MMNGVLQRLRIVEYSPQRLVLREQPLLAWTIAALLAAMALSMLVFHFYGTAFLAIVIACIFLVDSSSRVITFDAITNSMTVEQVYFYKRKQAFVTELHHIGEASLHTSDDGFSQIILIDKMGNEMGFSVYSRDVRPWKDDIVLAINTVLNEAHLNYASSESAS